MNHLKYLYCLRKALHQRKMNAQQFITLLTLKEYGSQAVNNVQVKAGVLPAQMSRVLNNLESNKWIERIVDTADLRSFIVKLTNKGREETLAIIAEFDHLFQKETLV